MSVIGFQEILSVPLAQYLQLSAKIGGDVATQADFVKEAFSAQLAFIQLASVSSQPGQDQLDNLLKPTTDQISAIQDFREKHRTSLFFNHLSAISKSIPALGWVCVSPTPGPHVKEMNDAGQFYTNRVLKEWKDKDATHVKWAHSWVQTLSKLEQYIKQHHTTGLVWSVVRRRADTPPPPYTVDGTLRNNQLDSTGTVPMGRIKPKKTIESDSNVFEICTHLRIQEDCTFIMKGQVKKLKTSNCGTLNFQFEN